MGSSKKQTVGYRYSMTLHLGISLIADAIMELRAGGRQFWEGDITANTTIPINAKDLFGGDEKEGGIQGNLDVLLGGEDQPPDGLLSILQNGLQPGYRGFTSLVYNGLITSNNPYIKPWSVRVRSILAGWHGGEAWYPEKAPVYDSPALSLDEFKHVEMSCQTVAGISTVRLFVNGIKKAEHVLDFVPNGGHGVGGQTTIARYSSDVGDGGIYKGNLDNVRVTRAVRHTSDFAPSRAEPNADTDPFWSSVLICMQMNGPEGSTDWIDAKGNIWSADVGPYITTAKSVSGGASGNFDLGGRLNLPETEALNLGSNFTIDFWASPSQLSGCPICVNQTHAIHAGYSFAIQPDGAIKVVFGRNTWPADPVVMVENLAPRIVGMNPAHIIYQCLTDPQWGMGYPTATIDDASFRAAADRLFDEGMGLCFKWNNQATIQDFTQTVADHAGLVFGQDRRTGLFRMTLLRNDYDVDALPVFTQKDVRVVRYQRPAMADTVNEVLVDFIDVLTGDDATTPPAQNLANIQGQGRVVSVTLSYAGLPTMDLANRVAMRELRARSTPLWQIQLEFKRKAFSLFPGDPFVLDLLDHPIGAKLVMRAGELDFGSTSDALIRSDTVEDAFGLPKATYTEDPGSGGPLPDSTPQAAITSAFEAPYIELAQAMTAAGLAGLPADAGFLAATGVKPTSNAMNYRLWTSLPPADYTEAGQGDFAPTGLLAVAAGKEDTELTLSDMIDLSELEEGTAAFLGEHPNAEMVRIDAVDTTTGVVTVGRGCGDTVPGGGIGDTWPIGTRLWGYDLYGAADQQQYIDGETVNAKLLTHSGSGNLDLDQAPVASVTMASRQARPYPPAQFKIDGSYYPAAVVNSGTPTNVTWAHRDRVLQADTLLDTLDDSIGPEARVSYSLRFLRADTEAVLVYAVALSGTAATFTLAYAGDVIAELWAVGDGGESWQRQRHQFNYSPAAASSTIEGTPYIPDDDGVIIIDGNGSDLPPTTTAPPPASGGAGVPGVPTARAIGATVVDPVTYGASPSASAATNSTAFNAAYAALPGGGGIVRPSVSGTYQINTANPLLHTSYTRLDLGTNSVTLQAAYTSDVTGPTNHRDIIRVDGKTEWEICGGHLIGYREAWAANGGRDVFGASEWAHGIFVTSTCSNGSIYDITAEKFVGDGLSIGRSPHDIHVLNMKSTNNRRQGISCGGDNIKIENCECSYIGGSDGTAPMSGIDIEVDDPATWESTGVQLINCYLHHNTRTGLTVYKSCDNVTIQGTRIHYNGTQGIYAMDSDNVDLHDSEIKWNGVQGVSLNGTSSGWDIDGNDFFANMTRQYGTPTTGPTTTTPTATQKAKHIVIASTVTGTTFGTNTYGPI